MLRLAVPYRCCALWTIKFHRSNGKVFRRKLFPQRHILTRHSIVISMHSSCLRRHVTQHTTQLNFLFGERCARHKTSIYHPFALKRFHNHSPIEFNSNRGGINLETEKTHDGTTSRLLLTRAQFRDGGNYTCMPHGAIPASGFVHVLNGERAKLQHSCFLLKSIQI